jgi:hypothetical protein
MCHGGVCSFFMTSHTQVPWHRTPLPQLLGRKRLSPVRSVRHPSHRCHVSGSNLRSFMA